jgi:hypothetical protein
MQRGVYGLQRLERLNMDLKDHRLVRYVRVLASQS